MKIGFVVPRYGAAVIGGAESGARQLAEHLAGIGVEVEVFTTRALEARTWADSFPAGATTESGVVVHRFSSRSGRDPSFDEYSTEVLRHPEIAGADVQERWLRLQGPDCPDALAAALDSGADALVYYPYLYLPTVAGVAADPARAVVHPAAHDEPPLRLPIFGQTLTRARALVFHTAEEAELVRNRFPVAGSPQLLLGLGVDAGEPDRAAPARHGVADRPYLLCVGRVDAGKGTNLLARWFAAYQARHGGGLRLVYVGPVGDPPPEHPDIVVTGPITEAEKWGLLAGATALVSPSAYESFSLVILEAWLAGIPVIVNARCGPTSGQVARSGGGIAVDGYAHFEVSLERLTGDAALRSALAAAGRTYTERRYGWPAVLARYVAFLDRVVIHGRRQIS